MCPSPMRAPDRLLRGGLWAQCVLGMSPWIRDNRWGWLHRLPARPVPFIPSLPSSCALCPIPSLFSCAMPVLSLPVSPWLNSPCPGPQLPRGPWSSLVLSPSLPHPVPFCVPHAVPSGLSLRSHVLPTPIPFVSLCRSHPVPPVPSVPPDLLPDPFPPSFPLSPPISSLSHLICPEAFPPSPLSLPSPALSPPSPPTPLVLFCWSHPDPPVPSDPPCPIPCLVPSDPPCPALPVPSRPSCPLQSPLSHLLPPVPLCPRLVPTIPVLPRLPPAPWGSPVSPSRPTRSFRGSLLAPRSPAAPCPGREEGPRGGPAPVPRSPLPDSPLTISTARGSRLLGGAGTENWIFLRSLGSMALAGSHRTRGGSLAPVPSGVRWHPGLGKARNESGGRWGRQSR